MQCVKTWEIYVTQQPIFSKWTKDNVTKLCMDNDPFKVQEWPTGVNVTKKEKLTDMFTDFTEQLNFKKLSLVKFWCSIKKEYNYLKRLLKYPLFSNYMRPDSSHIL